MSYNNVIFRKKGDTSRGISDTLLYNNAAVDISGSTIILVKTNLSDGTITRSSASVDLTSTGSVTYTIQASDVATTGSWACEWEVIYGDGAVEHFPTTENILLRVVSDIS